ncbi:aldehyde dehydrogenase family protein [Microbulbifer agarilyticus]|uniref:aldehyde dehydrogenase family protein n=1 Tax=Microbulbifer agarilyticus TaxID=260552 RepID=UPI001CD6019B|nr:aldehyde dehydrogenase family protein [Microbulbifer agarilyticus]MCA0899539.1 aldehyde dehydrogenase family protein [Microbulbifer agarilyticus]
MTSIQKTISPVDNSVYVQRQQATMKEITHAVSTAGAAQAEWNTVPLAKRQDLCSAAISSLLENKSAIAEELCWQIGRPIRQSEGEIRGVAERARYMIDVAPEALSTIYPTSKNGYKRYIRREAVGTVLVIAPWNYPYLTAINAIIPALLAGNSVLLKHSAQTPICAERLFQAFESAGLPKGVFQYLHLSHQHTESLIADPGVDYVAFTGSVEGGEIVEKAAAGRFIGVGLELGGKDPAYVRADADLDHAAATIVEGAFFNSGQSCCGIERVYLHESIHDNFIEKAVEIVKGYKLGRPDESDTTLGPVVRSSSAEYIRRQIKDALEKGGVAQINPDEFPLNADGSPYLAPQIVTNANHTMRLMTEESFGPVIGVQKVANDSEAIRLMNDSDFGLTASIFTCDTEEAESLGKKLQVGTFYVNQCDYLDPALAWSGVKRSGRGCTLSKLGYSSLTRPKSFNIKI